MQQPLLISKPFIGTFSEVLGVSSSAELDSGRCPKNPPTFEKVGSKLLYLQQPLFSFSFREMQFVNK